MKSIKTEKPIRKASRKQATEEKVFAYIQEHKMLEPGQRVVAGVSGGADSVCLLFVLLEWAKRFPLEMAVVHVNHGIRAEAGEDARYVEQLCRDRNLPYYLIEEDVHRRAMEWKCSEEEAGRRVRYEAFARVAQAFGAAKTAVAHNSNDRSETMLFHLFRGSGLKGLGSIQPVRENIIRPLLCLERSEIEAYLQELGISYCQDVTNSGDDYTRNRIRHHVLPYVEEEISRGCVRHMAQTAEMLSETEDYLEQQTAAAWEQCLCEEKASDWYAPSKDAYRISAAALREQHPVIQKRLLHWLVKKLSPQQRDISYVHIQKLLGLFAEEGSRTVCLPFGIRGRREYETVVIEKQQERNEKTELTIVLPSRGELSQFSLPQTCLWEKEFQLDENCVIRCAVFLLEDRVSLKNGCESQNFMQKIREVSQNEYTKWLDYDKIKGCITVRNRRTGDFLTISDSGGGMIHKSIKDYMITQKIPRVRRDQILLLAEGSHVLWLTGYRISEFYKICENTKYVLQVQLMK